MRLLASLVVSILALSCPTHINAAIGSVPRSSFSTLSSAVASESVSSDSTSSLSSLSSSSSHAQRISGVIDSSGSISPSDYLTEGSFVQPNSHFLTITNSKGEEIQEQKGRWNKIQVIATSHEIVSPRDSGSGMATGRRMHKPYVFRIATGSSTPALYQAFVNGETLKSIKLERVEYKDPKSAFQGKADTSFAILLGAVEIGDIQMIGETLQITCYYQKIEWTWVDGGVTAVDNWEARK